MMPRRAITVEVQCRIVPLRWLLHRTKSQAGCEVELRAHLRRNIEKSTCRNELGIQNDPLWPRGRASNRATSQTRQAILGGTILVHSFWFGLVPRLVRIAINNDDVTMLASR